MAVAAALAHSSNFTSDLSGIMFGFAPPLVIMSRVNPWFIGAVETLSAPADQQRHSSQPSHN